VSLSESRCRAYVCAGYRQDSQRHYAPFFGWVSDNIGRELTMLIAFALEAIGIIALSVTDAILSHS